MKVFNFLVHTLKMSHPLPLAIISEESPLYPPRDKDLEKTLSVLGFPFYRIEGQYGGVKENSYMVYGINLMSAISLGQNFGQESIVYCDSDILALIYTNGEKQGQFHPGLEVFDFSEKEPTDDFSKLPDRGYLTLHFDWDTLVEVRELFIPPIRGHLQ